MPSVCDWPRNQPVGYGFAGCRLDRVEHHPFADDLAAEVDLHRHRRGTLREHGVEHAEVLEDLQGARLQAVAA